MVGTPEGGRPASPQILGDGAQWVRYSCPGQRTTSQCREFNSPPGPLLLSPYDGYFWNALLGSLASFTRASFDRFLNQRHHHASGAAPGDRVTQVARRFRTGPQDHSRGVDGRRRNRAVAQVRPPSGAVQVVPLVVGAQRPAGRGRVHVSRAPSLAHRPSPSTLLSRYRAGHQGHRDPPDPEARGCSRVRGAARASGGRVVPRAEDGASHLRRQPAGSRRRPGGGRRRGRSRPARGVTTPPRRARSPPAP